MKRSFYINMRGFLCFALLLTLLTGAFCLSSSAEHARQYSVVVDNPGGATSTQGMPAIIKGLHHGTDPTLKLSGWIKSEYTMKYYEYTIDGGLTWVRDDHAVQARGDVQSHCPNTYKTAGYELDIDVSGLPRGEYDVFLRGYTDKGEIIEVLALLNVQIGSADTHTMTYTDINLRAFDFKLGKVTLPADQPLLLGAYNLRNYQSVEFLLEQDAVLTLSSGEDATISFRASTDAAVQDEDGRYVATIDLKNVRYAGDLYLTAQSEVGIRRIRLFSNVPDYYKGELVVHMTSTPYEHLGGANSVDASLLADETVGTYTHLYPTNDTNDPYIYFNLGKYLQATQGVQITADYYRYAVMTLQMPESNPHALFRLFLCAGEIHGPHGDSHVAFQPINDGQWHTYVIPLCEEEYWNGTIYGMRFDFIDANAKTSDYANIASIGFYPDEQSAKEAAAQPLTVYHESGKQPTDQFKEEGRAPSGKADAITWFDQSLADCFGGENKARISFDSYGHLILHASETSNDPFVSFYMKTYSELTGLPMLRTEQYGIVVLRILADKEIQGKNFTLYYYAAGKDFAEGERSVGAPYKGGEWEYLIYNMAMADHWTDEILGFRLDFSTQIRSGQSVCLSDILFFPDMAAWDAYAAEHNITYGDAEQTEPPSTDTQPETEAPTIEIPTQGPGLEYVSPETETEPPMTQNSASCKSILSCTTGILLSFAAVALIHFNTKKRR